jgi:hypothetical protein
MHRPPGLLQAALPNLEPDQLQTLVKESLAVRAFCAFGREQGYWEHAEEFLAMVETAAKDAASDYPDTYSAKLLGAMLKGTVVYPRSVIRASQIHNIPSSLPPYSDVPGPLHEFETMNDLLNAARRAVVVDCWTFLRGATAELLPGQLTERWKPYVDWASTLTDRDAILTFNYDAVPEYLESVKQPYPHNYLKIIRPTQVEAHQKNPKGVVPVYKLHGSVTWTITNDGQPDTKNVVGAVPRSLQHLDIQPLIALPGPTKLEHCSSFFEDLWRVARLEILEASEIIFIGYRFPPTDAYSQDILLDAIASAEHLKAINIVLGTRSRDTERMEHLLTGKAPRILSEFCTDYLLRHNRYYRHKS